MRRNGLIFFVFLSLLAVTLPALAVDINEFEQNQSQQYGPEYFFAIEGEIYGQTAPGVEAVYINGSPVKVEADLSFISNIKLKEGQKYLTIETRYQGLRFVKKYLVIRHPKVTQPFAIHVPKKEFEEIIKNEPLPAEEPGTSSPRPALAKTKNIEIADFQGYEKENLGPEYFNAIDINVSGQAPSGVESITFNGRQAPLKADATFKAAIKMPEGQKNLMLETKYRGATYSKSYLILRKSQFESFNVQVSPDEIQNIIRGKAIAVSPVIIIKSEPTAARFKEAAIKSPPRALIKKPSPEPVDEKWLGYQFVAELAPGKLLTIKEEDGKFLGWIFNTADNTWVQLDKISPEELADLLAVPDLYPSSETGNKL